MVVITDNVGAILHRAIFAQDKPAPTGLVSSGVLDGLMLLVGLEPDKIFKPWRHKVGTTRA